MFRECMDGRCYLSYFAKYKIKKMKIIIKPGQREISKIICNNCHKPAVSYLTWEFGYGSDNDLNTWFLDMCNDCGQALVKYMTKKYKNIKKKKAP